MTGKHTPGPWRVSQHDALRYTWHVNAGPAGYEQKRVAIAPGDSPADCAEANALLISAAPDMLEALRVLVAEWEYVHGCLPDDHAAITAIARAEGGGV